MKTLHYVVFALLLTLVSCTDHEVPAPASPVIKFPVSTPWWDLYDDDNLVMNVEFTQLGNRPIVSYGIVVVAGPDDQDLLPTVNDTRIVFSNPPVAGINSHIYPITSYDMLWPDPRNSKALFFRAYVEVQGGTIFYGDTVERTGNL